jgi:hypothetical protein
MFTETTTEKQGRERSKAYPGANLEDCAEHVRQIKINLGKGVHDRDSLAKAMGYDKATGTVNPKIAALVHFGFLQRAQGGYALTPNAAHVTDPVNDDEKKDELRAAFIRPTLYQELVEKFAAEGQIPVQLATHLHRFHGITDAASTVAADIFLESGRFAGVLDNDGKILINGAPSANGSGEKSESTVQVLPASKQSVPPVIPEEKRDTGTTMQRFEFAISEGQTATITVPSRLNEKDIRIIKKQQIELLELQAGVEETK